MFTKISTLIALHFYLAAYFVNATLIDIPEDLIKLSFFRTDSIELDRFHRITNPIGDIKYVTKDTIDETCKSLQVRRLQKLYPMVLANEQNTEFGDFVTQPAAVGAKSIAVYDYRVPRDDWEIGRYEYLELPVYRTPCLKEIYHVPSLKYVDPEGYQYSIDDGYFGLDDYNVKGQPLVFEIIGNDEAKLVAYEDSLLFSIDP